MNVLIKGRKLFTCISQKKMRGYFLGVQAHTTAWMYAGECDFRLNIYSSADIKVEMVIWKLKRPWEP